MIIEKDTYIYKKEIDWSALNLGINIPVSIQVVFHDLIQHNLKKGDSLDIQIIIDGKYFEAKLVNIKFDERKYPTHKELIQIRYSPTSEISEKLKSKFSNSFEFLQIEKDKLTNKRQHITVPEYLKEFVVLYTTELENVFLLDCITNDEIEYSNEKISRLTEEEYEFDINYFEKDDTSKITIKPQIVKLRKLNKSICNNLKLLYNYRCQICGEIIGESCNGIVTEAHHIESFTKTFNNDSDNILVVCPNHHRIIHKTNPLFKRKELMYLYPNGLEEKLILNFHL